MFEVTTRKTATLSRPILRRLIKAALKACPVGLRSRHALPVRIFSPRFAVTS